MTSESLVDWKIDAVELEPAAQIGGVDQVAVVGDADAAVGVLDGERLRVAQARAAGGRVTDVTDGEVAGQLLELAARERVGDEALLLPLVEAVTVGRDDAGRFLPAMLQGVQARGR